MAALQKNRNKAGLLIGVIAVALLSFIFPWNELTSFIYRQRDKAFTVDGEVVNIPSYSVKQGQVIAVREKDKSMSVIVDSLNGFNHSKYPWLEWDNTAMAGKFLHTPERADIPENIKEQLIVELYSK